MENITKKLASIYNTLNEDNKNKLLDYAIYLASDCSEEDEHNQEAFACYLPTDQN